MDGIGIRKSSISQVGYFLSPFDFLRELFTFFLFKAAFKRFVLFLFFMSSSYGTPARIKYPCQAQGRLRADSSSPA